MTVKSRLIIICAAVILAVCLLSAAYLQARKGKPVATASRSPSSDPDVGSPGTAQRSRAANRGEEDSEAPFHSSRLRLRKKEWSTEVRDLIKFQSGYDEEAVVDCIVRHYRAMMKEGAWEPAMDFTRSVEWEVRDHASRDRLIAFADELLAPDQPEGARTIGMRLGLSLADDVAIFARFLRLAPSVPAVLLRALLELRGLFDEAQELEKQLAGIAEEKRDNPTPQHVNKYENRARRLTRRHEVAERMAGPYRDLLRSTVEAGYYSNVREVRFQALDPIAPLVRQDREFREWIVGRYDLEGDPMVRMGILCAVDKVVDQPEVEALMFRAIERDTSGDVRNSAIESLRGRVLASARVRDYFLRELEGGRWGERECWNALETVYPESARPVLERVARTTPYPVVAKYARKALDNLAK